LGQAEEGWAGDGGEQGSGNQFHFADAGKFKSFHFNKKLGIQDF